MPEYSSRTQSPTAMRLLPYLLLLAVSSMVVSAQQIQAVRAPERAQPDHSYFGAAIAHDGSHLLIGAPGESTGSLTRHGAAYLFEPSPSERLVQRFTASDATIFDSFGQALALDAGRAAVGAPHHWGGAVYVFHEQEGAWSEFQRISVEEEQLSAQFGTALALDGTTLLVGAPRYGEERGGAVFVYTFDGTAWQLEDRLDIPDADARSRFGAALALEGDRALVGAPGAHGSAEHSGAVFVYRRDATGWTLEETLAPGDLARHVLFGTSVDLDGDLALVGSLMHVVEDVGPAGAAFLFTRSADGWAETERFTPPGPTRNDYFGHQVVLRGGRIAVSAPRAEKNDRRDVGAVYLFERAQEAWQFVHRVEPQASTEEHTYFGGALALSNEHVFVGSHLENEAGDDGGNAYFIALIDLVGTESDDDAETAPLRFALAAPAPNPFRESTRLRFDLPEPARVRVTVHDVLGREVAVVADAPYPAGRSQEVIWRPGRLGAGVYFVRFRAGDFRQTERVVLVN